MPNSRIEWYESELNKRQYRIESLEAQLTLADETIEKLHEVSIEQPQPGDYMAVEPKPESPAPRRSRNWFMRMFQTIAFVVLLATTANAQVKQTGSVWFSIHKSEALTHETSVTVESESFGCDFTSGAAACSTEYLAASVRNAVTLANGHILRHSTIIGCVPPAKDCSDELNTPPDESTWKCSGSWCTAEKKFDYFIKEGFLITRRRAVYHADSYVRDEQ